MHASRPWLYGSTVLCLALGGCGTDEPLVASRLTFDLQPLASATSAQSIGPVRVTVLTADGQIATSGSYTVSLSLSSADTAARLGGTTTATTAAGIATFSDLSVGRAGTGFKLVARTTGLDSTVSGSFAVSAGPASRLIFDAIAPSPVAVGATIPVVARVADAAGNPTSSGTPTVTLGFERTGSFGTSTAPDAIFGTTTATAVSGAASFDGINFHKSGFYRLVATAPGLTTATSGQLTIQAATMTHLEFLTQPSAGSANVALPAFSVQQLDAFGNGVSLPPGPPYTVTLALASNPSGATLRGTLAQSVNGATAVSFGDIVIDKPGTGYTLVATSGSSTVTSAQFTVR